MSGSRTFWRSGDGGQQVTLGVFGAVHLGDTLCASPLPRLLAAARGLRVYVADGPNARAVFENNPHVHGFTPGSGGALLSPRAKGCGHVIQRLLQGFELSVEPLPRPEVYLCESERAWAARERQTWPPARPACVLSTGAVTHREQLGRVDWPSVARVLSRHCTVVQPVLSEAPVPEAVAYRGLTTRQYMALVSVADCFVGGNSGGSHVAAAFDVPSLIAISGMLKQQLRFPVSGLGFDAWFLYPQHRFVAVEDLLPGVFRAGVLESAFRGMLEDGRQGQESPPCNHTLNPCGLALRATPRVCGGPGRRFIRLPGRYGEHPEARPR